jgi:hypothetical protein
MSPVILRVAKRKRRIYVCRFPLCLCRSRSLSPCGRGQGEGSLFLINVVFLFVVVVVLVVSRVNCEGGVVPPWQSRN